ncbi:MAG: YciK family oxidoreductase [Chromatiales bacterium]|jgi:NAD(P)-dependent dehydrogenase (short-subunit alcohol dehydrogenase family)
MSANTSVDITTYRAAPDLLRDRRILVTGAGDGIGRAAALAFAAHGATVILLGRTIKKLEDVYDQIEAAGGNQPAIYPLNLEGATVKDYDDLAENIGTEFGRLDALLSNAGWVGSLTPLRHYDPELWSRVMMVNLHAPFLLIRACLPLLEQAEDPAVVFSAHESSRAYWGAFGAAKAGLVGLMRILADEYETEGRLRANSVDPGPVRTNLRAHHYPGEDPGKLPAPEDVLAPYLYFIGPDSRGVTGQLFQLNP